MAKIYPKPACAFCTELEERSNRRDGGPRAFQYHCCHGRFDKKGKERWFSPSGIGKPNKTVTQAQKDCPLYNPKPLPLGTVDRLFGGREDNDVVE